MKYQKMYYLIMFILTAIGACKNNNNEAYGEKKIQVKTVIVESKEVALAVHSSGRLSSGDEMKLSFKTGGILQTILAEEGQNVKKGQLLARLDPSEIKPKAEQAGLSFEKAQRDYTRMKNLYHDSVATLEQYQDVQTTLDVARANKKIAEFNLEYSSIKAPEDGWILKRLTEEREMVAPGHPVFLFGTYGKGWVIRVNITDREIFRLMKGDSAHICFDAFPGKILSGYVTEIGKFADPYTGTYEVEIRVHPVKKPLASGLFGRVDIFPSKKEKYLLIPIDALYEGDDMQGYVYTYEGGDSVLKRRITIKTIADEYLLVSEGLAEGMHVITEGVTHLKNHSKVEVVKK